MDDMIREIIEDLTVELQDRPGFNADVLKIKVNNALREVCMARGYLAAGYSDEMINDDIVRFYTNIRNIALFDISQQVGAEFNSSLSENGIYRTYRDRDKLFVGIIPLTKLK